MEIRNENNKRILQYFFISERYWSILKNISSMELETLKENIDAQLKAERIFEILVQVLLDVCSQIVENSTGNTLNENIDCLRKLNDLGIISSELTEKGFSLIKKREIVLHKYGNLNYSVLLKDLKKLKKYFIQFQNAILQWIESEEEQNS